MQASRRGIRLFRVLGVTIQIDYSWFIFFFLVVWTFGRFYFPQYDASLGGALGWVLAFAEAGLLFFSVVFHEMSHAVVSNRLNAPIRRITLFIFGGLAHMSSEPKDARTEFLVAAAGPISSLFLWVVFMAAAVVAHLTGQIAAAALFGVAAQLNLVLALFNLVPGFPLDGGRLLRAGLWWKTRSLRRATNVAAKGGEIVAYALIVLGAVSFIRNPSEGWVVGIWYILIGVFLKFAAEKSYENVLLEEVLEEIAVGDVMGSNRLAVEASGSIGMLVAERFRRHKFTTYPVVDAEEKVVGVVELDDVRDIPAGERLERTVGSVMQPIGRRVIPRAETPAYKALKLMLALGVGSLPVVDSEGKLVGIVTESDVMNTFRIRSGLGE
jgi:Zn-dependent protease/CBS domain-containing protein